MVDGRFLHSVPCDTRMRSQGLEDIRTYANIIDRRRIQLSFLQSSLCVQ